MKNVVRFMASFFSTLPPIHGYFQLVNTPKSFTICKLLVMKLGLRISIWEIKAMKKLQTIIYLCSF